MASIESNGLATCILDLLPQDYYVPSGNVRSLKEVTLLVNIPALGETQPAFIPKVSVVDV